MDYLIVLANPYSFLLTMLKLSKVVGWPMVDWLPFMGVGVLGVLETFHQMF